MKRNFKFRKNTFLSILIITICFVLLTGCGSKYGQKTAYLEYSSANSAGCSGSNAKAKADWIVDYIENGVESSVNEYLISIQNESYYQEASAAVESIKLTGSFNGNECVYVDADNNEVKTRSYISNLERLINDYIDADNKKAIANTDDEAKINNHFQVALINNDIAEFKSYIGNVNKADKASLDNIKVAIKDKRKELKEIGAQWDELTPEEIAVKLVSSGRVEALYKAMKERENKINPSDFFSDQYQ